MGYLSKDEYSKNEIAIKERTERLLNDKRANNHVESNRRYNARKKAEKLLAVANDRGSRFVFTNTSLQRMKHHLSKGRDASDIAVREGWLVSDVVKLIDMVEAKG